MNDRDSTYAVGRDVLDGELLVHIDGDEPAPPPDFARTRAAAEAVGVRLLGPPPFSPTSIDQTSG